MLTENRQMVESFTGISTMEVIADVHFLKSLHEPQRESRRKLKDVMNGGAEGIAALLGQNYKGDTPPVNNLIYSGLSRLAQKIGRLPDLRISANRDTQVARDNAEMRERMVLGYDDGCQLDMMLPQVGRWLPGYGFAVVTIHDGFDADGNPYPMATLRDPFDCYPSSWGITQQPDRLAIVRDVPASLLAKQYPEHADEIRKGNSTRGPGGAVILGGSGERTGSWAGNGGDSVEIAEYIDKNGTWTVVCDLGLLLDFTPNPIAPLPPFVVGKRFSFDRLTGHYDHVIGLMMANAKLNLLALISMEDAVFAETVVSGELARGDKWIKGRDAVNYLQPGSTVSRLGSGVNPQMFNEIDRIERQLRTTAGYSVTDDGQSPNSFVTGRGLDNLQAGVDNEVTEYQTVLTRMVERVDMLRLCWDEKAYVGLEKPLHGRGKRQSYSPGKDIKGLYKTTRRYGVMAGWDDASKVVTGLQLLQAEIVDTLTVQENIRGLDDVTEVRKRIATEKAERSLNAALEAAAAQGDPRAVMALIEMMPASDMKQTLQKFFTPEGPEMSEQEQQMAEPPPDAGPDSTTTILSRLMGSGEAQGGAQTVGVL